MYLFAPSPGQHSKLRLGVNAVVARRLTGKQRPVQAQLRHTPLLKQPAPGADSPVRGAVAPDGPTPSPWFFTRGSELTLPCPKTLRAEDRFGLSPQRFACILPDPPHAQNAEG